MFSARSRSSKCPGSSGSACPTPLSIRTRLSPVSTRRIFWQKVYGTDRARNAARPSAASDPWQVRLTTTVEYVLLLVALPLLAIQLWLATARHGLKAAFKSSVRLIATAFAPGSVLVYVIGFVVFAVIPYFLLFTKTPSSNAWIDAGLFAGRLFVAALLLLFGWVATVSALGELRSGDSTAGEVNQGAEHAPVVST